MYSCSHEASVNHPQGEKGMMVCNRGGGIQFSNMTMTPTAFRIVIKREVGQISTNKLHSFHYGTVQENISIQYLTETYKTHCPGSVTHSSCTYFTNTHTSRLVSTHTPTDTPPSQTAFSRPTTRCEVYSNDDGKSYYVTVAIEITGDCPSEWYEL